MWREKKIQRKRKSMSEWKIVRKQVMEAFKKYTDAYDSSDEKIKLKIAHTYRVAALCERIAKSEGMPEREINLAWLLGMLHDVGRFEQLRRYGTFLDRESIDHAALGADILFLDGEIRRYTADDSEDHLLELAVRVHNAYRIPENLDTRTEKFCNILRDADKIDILRVNVEVPLEEIYDATTEELRGTEISHEVIQSFSEHHAVLAKLKKTPVDHVAGHISLAFELVFDESRRIVAEQGYLERLMNFESANPKTKEQFAVLREEMQRYLTHGA